MARDWQVRSQCFIKFWKLAGLACDNQTSGFLEAVTLAHFVLKHPVKKGETLPMLAVKYGVDVTTLKRMNNIMTDHSLMSRIVVYIPVVSAEAVKGSYVAWEYCRHSCRRFAVLSDCPDKASLQKFGLTADAFPVSTNKLCTLLGKSLRVDDETAKYYMDIADGDIKTAMKYYEQDTAWEQNSSSIRRVGALRGWVES